MKRLLKLILILILFISSGTFNVKAQVNETFWERVYFGGNLGLQFGDLTVVNINPLVGYRITEKFSIGLTATYIYLKVTDPYFPTYSTNIFGGSVFTRYFFLENIFGHVEGELINREVYDVFQDRLKRVDVFGFYVGGGLRQPMGDRSSINIMLLYNLNEDRNSPYQNPIIRIGLGFGI